MRNVTRILLLCFFGISQLAVATERRSPGEVVATKYMEAFFRSDIEAAAEFLGPSILDPFKTMIVAQVEAAGSEERTQVLAAIGYSSIDELRKALARDLFVRVTKSQRMGAREFAEKAKDAVVVVEKLEKVDAEKQRITLRIHIRSLEDQLATVVVQLVDGRWLIVGI
jgi:hypothetical protein